MSKGSGLSRSERRRNARKEYLRSLVPRDGAVVGIDLGVSTRGSAGFGLRGTAAMGKTVMRGM